MLNAELTREAPTFSSVLRQIEALLKSESDVVANLANTASVLYQSFEHYFWVGFYRVDQDAQNLVLSAFQGTVACTRIAFDKGVCGACYREQSPILVPDVHAFPGHIACDPNSKSEIVIPIILEGKVRFVLDIDSDILDGLSRDDFEFLKEVGVLIQENINL